MKYLFLTTVFNRCEQTIACLTTLNEACSKLQLNAKFVIVDDNSTDGTLTEINRLFPEVDVVQGSGSLFWAGGMRHGFSHVAAEGYDYDFLVAFNDDIMLSIPALKKFFAALQTEEILVGAFMSSRGELTYGGRRQTGFWPLNFGAVSQSDLGGYVDVANFNFVAIPQSLLKRINFIDDYFIHNGADFDFSLRARKAGFPIKMFDESIGIAERNSLKDTSLDKTLNIKLRFKKLISYKEYPIRQRFKFCWNHGGSSWFLWFIRPYIGFCFKLLWSR